MRAFIYRIFELFK